MPIVGESRKQNLEHIQIFANKMTLIMVDDNRVKIVGISFALK